MATKKKVTKKKAAKKKTGRKKIKIPWKKVDRLLRHHCTGTQVAAALNIHHDTLYDACQRDHKTAFSVYSRQKKDSGVTLLKDAQFKKALGGHHIMQIFLGKNYAEQADKPIPEKTNNKGTIMETLNKLMEIKEK